ncbi:MAG TPA: prolipoprotein diacylglyceryl transferase family protein [Anaerolineae bacterium]|nr:prolipoprotein diacylglyceryl transferase family protein [Anaerolineae bacterium]
MLPIIQVGPLVVPSRGLILLATFWVASWVAERAAKRLGLRGDDVYNLGFYGLVAGLLGARLGYVIQYWSVYQNDLGAIFALNLNTLSPAAGLLAALAVAYWYARRKRIVNRRLLDALTPGLVVFAAGLALADLASGDGYGAPAQLPWSINLWGELRHPTQIYHLLAASAIGVVVWRSSRPFDGAHFGLCVALYAASRLFLETFHGDSEIFAGVRVVQVWSLIALVIALLLLRRWAGDWARDVQPANEMT